MKLLIVLALVVAATAGNVPFTDCSGGSGHAKITALTADPFPPVKGKAITITGTGQLNEQVTASQYELTVDFLGVQLLKKSGDLCTLSPKFKCPHAAGAISVSETLTIPSVAPSGSYSITLNATDQNKAELLCVKLTVTISEDEVSLESVPAVSQEIVDLVNSRRTTWTAGFSRRFDGKSLAHVKGLCGAKKEINRPPVRRITRMSNIVMEMPTAFDSREQWGSICPSTKEVRDQGACGSCWAFGAVESMTDRICIQSNGSHTPHLSAEDVLSCCGFSCGMGCEGGYPSAAWSYFQGTGVVTGGQWDSKQGCYPYQIASCDHHVKGTKPPCGSIQSTPSCSKTCQNGATWSADKHFGKTVYSVPSDVASIQQEIFSHGPVEAAYTVYADFPSYKSGVYQHTTGSALGGHAVKIIGWGVENGTPYWTVANSWNTQWGDKGFFKILRGQDECGIESQIVAGLTKGL